MNNLPIDYKGLKDYCISLIKEMEELKRTIHYYQQSIETYKRMYNAEKQKDKKC